MPDTFDADALLLVGRVWRAHGTRGEVKVLPETDEPGRFKDLPVVFTGRTPGTATAHTVESVRLQPARRGVVVVLKLRGVDTRTDAESLRRLSVFALPEDLPPLQDDEYFVHDLVGLSVVTDEGARVGVVDEVMPLPAHDVIVVGREGRDPAMIPVVREFVVDVDVGAATIVVRPIEGLID